MAAMLSPAVAGDAASAQVASQAVQGPALQLLLRFLPFRSSNSKLNNQPVQQMNRHTLLEELHKNTLWRFSSIADGQRPKLEAAVRDNMPHVAHDALLDYVRMAADAEQQQKPQAPQHCYRRSGQLSAAEAAAELHALYTLAVVQVASQQQQQQQQQQQHSRKGHAHGKSLTDGDFLDLLKAYASLGDADNSSSQRSSGSGTDSSTSGSGGGSVHQKQQAWEDSSAQTAAVAVQALYAFAKLADSAQQAQHEGQTLAPGQLQGNITAAPSSSKTGSSASSSRSSTASGEQGAGYHISSHDSSQQDLCVLLKLAQLGAQA